MGGATRTFESAYWLPRPWIALGERALRSTAWSRGNSPASRHAQGTFRPLGLAPRPGRPAAPLDGRIGARLMETRPRIRCRQPASPGVMSSPSGDPGSRGRGRAVDSDGSVDSSIVRAPALGHGPEAEDRGQLVSTQGRKRPNPRCCGTERAITALAGHAARLSALWSICVPGSAKTAVFCSPPFTLGQPTFTWPAMVRGEHDDEEVAMMLHNSADLIVPIDVRQLDTVRPGVLRLMFPAFAAEMELGRCMRRVLSSGRYATVHFEPHRDVDGRLSLHVFDVYGSEASAVTELVRPPARRGFREAFVQPCWARFLSRWMAQSWPSARSQTPPRSRFRRPRG